MEDESVPLIVWTTVESDLIVIAACVPTLHPLYDRVYVKAKRLVGIVSPDAPIGSQAEQTEEAEQETGRRVGYWTHKLNDIVSYVNRSTPSNFSAG